MIEDYEQLNFKTKLKSHERSDEYNKPQIPIPYPHTAFAFWSPIGSLIVVHNNQTIKNYKDHHVIDNEKDLNNYIYAPQKKIQVELQELNKNKDQNLVQDFQVHTDGIEQDFSEQGMKILADVDDDDYDYLTLNIQSSQTYFKNFKPDVTLSKQSHRKDKKNYDMQEQFHRNSEYENFDLSNNMVLFETYKNLIKNQSKDKEKRIKNQNSTVSIYDFSIYNYQIYDPFKKVSELFLQKFKKNNSNTSSIDIFLKAFQQYFAVKESKIISEFINSKSSIQNQVFECEFLTLIFKNFKEKLLQKSKGLLLLQALINYLGLQLETSMNQIYFRKQINDFLYQYENVVGQQISDSLRLATQSESINIDNILEKLTPITVKIPISPNQNTQQQLLIEQNQKQLQNQDVAPISRSIKSKANTAINFKYLIKTAQYITQKNFDSNILHNFTLQESNQKRKAYIGLSLILSNLSQISHLEYIIAKKQIFEYFKSLHQKLELEELIKRISFNIIKPFEDKINFQNYETYFDCSICQLKVITGQVIICPKCSHGGHYEHISKWFSKVKEQIQLNIQKQKCPKCFECQCFFLLDSKN